MADVRLTPQKISAGDGATVTRTALSTGNTYQIRVGPGVTVNWRKTGAGEATITVTTPGTVDGLAITDRTITVAASTGDVARLFNEKTYINSSGDLEFTTDEATGLTAAVFEAVG
jgi:hypothetical protein